MHNQVGKSGNDMLISIDVVWSIDDDHCAIDLLQFDFSWIHQLFNQFNVLIEC